MFERNELRTRPLLVSLQGIDQEAAEASRQITLILRDQKGIEPRLDPAELTEVARLCSWGLLREIEVFPGLVGRCARVEFLIDCSCISLFTRSNDGADAGGRW